MSEETDHDKRLRFAEILEALKESDCPLCMLTRKAVYEYFSSVLHECLISNRAPDAVRASAGFCRGHARDFVTTGDHRGVAIVYRDILRQILQGFSTRGIDGARASAVCPACDVKNRHEEMYVETLAHNLEDPSVRRDLDASYGLCLYHASRVVHRLSNPQVIERIMALSVRQLGAMRGNLSEFVRKQDVQFKNEVVSSEEQTACERAIDLLAGRTASSPGL